MAIRRTGRSKCEYSLPIGCTLDHVFERVDAEAKTILPANIQKEVSFSEFFQQDCLVGIRSELLEFLEIEDFSFVRYICITGDVAIDTHQQIISAMIRDCDRGVWCKDRLICVYMREVIFQLELIGKKRFLIFMIHPDRSAIEDDFWIHRRALLNSERFREAIGWIDKQSNYFFPAFINILSFLDITSIFFHNDHRPFLRRKYVWRPPSFQARVRTSC